MKRANQPKKIQGKVYRTIIAAALALGGTLHMVTAVLADGTAAGTQITNEATATYEDPNDPNNTPITTTSNEVVVQVAEVAGITVQPAGIEFNPTGGDADNDGLVDPDDQLYYIYEVTNVGNDPTEFFIPDTAVVTTNNGSQDGQIEISYDGTTWGDPRDTGFNPDGDGITDAIPPNGKVLVRVPIQVASNANPGDPVEVRLGNTPGDGQNQDYVPNGVLDVYTSDAPFPTTVGGVDEVDGDPANGTREASARQSIPVDSTLDTQPLVTIEKILSNYEANNAASLTDDELTYELRFEVEGTDTTGNTPAFTPGPLYPVDGISVDGGTGSHILVSDALPDHTVLSGTPTAPAGWTVVYSGTATTTNAHDADWFTSSTAPGLGGTITRVGFISDSSIISLAPTSVVETFRFTVETTNVPTGLTEATFANIAQVFGSADPGGDPNELVNDESGDSTPSNYNPTGGTGGTGGFDPPSDGYIPDDDDDGVPDDIDLNDPTAGDGTDPSNTNSGTGTGGEANIKTIGLPSSLDLINGPENEPEAIGPTGTNDDFTNKSVPVDPADITFDATDSRDELDPDPVDFANTVLNNGQTTGDITLVPTPPADTNDLPDGTIVTITDPDGETAIYEYNGTTFTRTGGTAGGDIVIPDVDPNDEVTYGVRVDLPDGTPLSTDTDGTGNPIGGFPVPITATLEDAGGNTASNITIDQVYTGYLQLAKESRILQGSGPAVQSGQGDFSADPKNPAPGNIIEYRVTYTNISETASGSNNVVLNAENVVINEDGTDGGNNWALDNDNNSVIDTSNVPGSATDSNGGTITYYSGAPANTPTGDTSGSDANTDVTRYVDQVPGLVGPGESGSLIFRRVLN
ncbi:MAG: hypothetical protein AAFY20_05420 [Cyanobacteria bacterium J06639_14]